MNELMQNELNSLVTKEFVDTLRKYDEVKVQYEVAKSEFENSIKEFMIKNNLDTYDDEVHGIRIKYVKPSIRKSVDTDEMKRQGIYESYLKETNVSDSVRITVRYD